MAVDLQVVRDCAEWLVSDDADEDDPAFRSWSAALTSLIVEVEAHRAIDGARVGSGAEERRRELIDLYAPLVFQNTAPIGADYAGIARRTLIMAEAMLAIELTEGMAAERKNAEKEGG
jgi:hypothetical protein